MNETPSGTTIKEISCEECRELLSDYVDREITKLEKAAVEHHISTCAKCGTESARLHGLKKIVQHWDGVKGSGEFRKSVVDKMIRESQQVPAEQFKKAIAASGEQDLGPDPEEGAKTLPPAWILLVAIFLAVLAYVGITLLRGGF
jgi:anti-sigma factor RsiW